MQDYINYWSILLTTVIEECTTKNGNVANFKWDRVLLVKKEVVMAGKFNELLSYCSRMCGPVEI